MDNLINFSAPAFEIFKSYRDDNGQMYVEGIAATTGIDLTGERMSPEVIAKMAARLVGKPLRSEHGKDWDDKLGEIVQADVKTAESGNPGLWIKARLFDWSSKAKDLFSLLQNGIEKMGLSVAGKINPGGLIRQMVDSVGKYIPTYIDVDPTEVSVTDHPANLDTFAYAVAKSLDLEGYNPDEFKKDAAVKQLLCEHEHCEHQKCLDKSCMNKCEKCIAMCKDDGDLANDDFLDIENGKYPADEKHLMPALRYFNHDGQRKAGKYEENKWSQMGQKLASKLSKFTGESYEFDSTSEKVIKVQKDTKKEVNNMDKGKLVSKTIPADVKQFAKEWGKNIDAEVKKIEVKKEDDVKKVAPAKEEAKVEKTEDKKVEVKKVEAKKEEVKKEDVKKGSTTTETPSTFSVGSDSSSSDGSTTTDSTDSTSTDSTDSDSSTGSTMESLLADLESTLADIKSSLAGSSTSDSDSSTEEDTSDKTSTDKAMDSTSSVSSTDSKPGVKDKDEMARALETLVQAANTMRELAEKAKPADGTKDPKATSEEGEGGQKGAAQDHSTSANVKGKVEPKANVDTKTSKKPKLDTKDTEAHETSTEGASTSKSELGEAVSALTALVMNMQKSLEKRDEEFTKLVEKKVETPQRKGVAILLEKNFNGYTGGDEKKVDEELLEKMKKDKDISFAEYHKYQSFGEVPAKYKTVEKKV